MKFSILFLLVALFTCSLQAITVAWKTPKNWNGETSWTTGSAPSIWLYQSASADLTAKQVFDATTGGNESARLGTTTNPTLSPGGTTFMAQIKSSASPNDPWEFTSDLKVNNYVYVVFQSNREDTSKGAYIVARSEKYTGDAASKSNGFFQTEAEARNEPNIGQYVELSNLGGTWSAATPEPTTLALLMFGVAGLALRRRF